MSKTIKYVECANCGEVVGTYYVTCPYCGYRLSARKPTTGMDPLYGMTDSEFYKRFGSIGHHSPAATRKPPRQTNEPARWRNNSTRRNHETR